MRDTRDVRATGLQGDAPPEIIEILDDDTNAFGNRASTLTSHDNGGPRWIGPVAAAALMVLIGYGVATSASTSGPPRTAPVTSSTIATTTTRPATSTTIPVPPVPYYAADLPREFSVQAADIQLHGDGGYFSPGNYALFATEGASAGTGRWFSISSYPGGQSIYATDAYRVLTDRGSVAISHLSSGQSTAQFSPDGSAAATLTAFGWSDEDLVRLAESIVLGRSGAVRFSDSSLVADHRLLTSVEPWIALQGLPVEQIYYTTADSPTGGIGILVSQRPSAREGGATLDRQVALRFFLEHSTSFDVDGHVAVAGAVLGQPNLAMATWIAGDHIVTVSGTVPVPQLVAMARTVHEVSADEWQGMQFQAATSGGNNNFGDYVETQPLPVSFGTDADGKSWIIRAGIATFANQKQVSWQWDGNGFGSEVDGTATISSVVDSKRTYVLAELPRAIAAKAELHIARAGLDPVIAPFNDIDPSLDRTFAAFAFSEPVQYTAQIVAADGTVLATWPST
jgi:hypothetical protein